MRLDAVLDLHLSERSCNQSRKRLLGIVFLAFFINLCFSRTLGAFKGDMAIMRSMGIPVKVIRVGMYVRMLIALIPAYLTVMIAATVVS